MARKTTRRMDPQQAKAIRMRRRKRHRLFFSIACVLLVCIAAVMATTVFFRVSQIEITGETRYQPEDLIGTSGISEGDNLFFLPEKSVQQSLSTTYPYLDTIEIKRHLPGTLEIAVTEREPMLSVQLADGKIYYLDGSGKVLERITEDEIGSTVHVIGVDAKELNVGQTVTDEDSEKIVAVLDMLGLFSRYSMLDKIVSVDISRSFDVYVDFDNRYVLELGRLDDLEHKIQFLKAILEQNDLPNTGIIDLSDGDEARYRPAAVETAAQEESEQSQDAEEDNSELDTYEEEEDYTEDEYDGEQEYSEDESDEDNSDESYEENDEYDDESEESYSEQDEESYSEEDIYE